MHVLVTGATGFVGRALCAALTEAGYTVRAAVRYPSQPFTAQQVVIGEVDRDTDWTAALAGTEAVVHLAARAHVVHGNDSADSYMRINALGTLQLATAAARHGVGRFVYLSTLKVNGERTLERPFAPTDEPHPADAYGLSKWHGEQHLADVVAKSDMRAAVIRPPLIYGPGVRANFLQLFRLVDRGLPLPFGAIRNRRSFASVRNVVDLIVVLLRRPALDGTWMVSDGEDLSTPELVRRIAAALGKRAALFPVPVGVLRVCGSLVGARPQIDRLCDSLTADIAATRAALGWSPPVTVEAALRETACWYRQRATGR